MTMHAAAAQIVAHAAYQMTMRMRSLLSDIENLRTSDVRRQTSAMFPEV